MNNIIQGRKNKYNKPNLQDYIFYFFEYFSPKREFINVEVNQKQWGRYDMLSKQIYGTSDYFWIFQIFDPKKNFWDMKYDYSFLVPQRIDVDEYVQYLNDIVLYNK